MTSSSPVHIARVFGVVPSWLDDAERELVVGYLRAAPIMLASMTLHPDRLDPGRGDAVGASYRTDGGWVWSDALTYHVRVHGLAPETRLLHRIRAHDYRCPTPDGAARERALAVLYESFREVTYHALLTGGRTRDDPAGMVRRTHTTPPVHEVFTRDLTWQPTDGLAPDAEQVEITEEEANAILDHWREWWPIQDALDPEWRNR